MNDMSCDYTWLSHVTIHCNHMTCHVIIHCHHMTHHNIMWSTLTLIMTCTFVFILGMWPSYDLPCDHTSSRCIMWVVHVTMHYHMTCHVTTHCHQMMHQVTRYTCTCDNVLSWFVMWPHIVIMWLCTLRWLLSAGTYWLQHKY